ncbi:hypothetical protein [Streptomyces europaeiscabiei]|uniref:hypothetical protein n=1 Tax=Streptomyces europaeiscabiei TaxID=146819 RepID=UPI0029A3E8E1|nr:hypothetical protein [Streptomyces europaeiscabiei]MDX3613276.1 hypothetical protein [Streptomyces europaeiscabiei]MDX3629106.1 hypothetical protein [Streptomyces europaeiscabiei]MDX3647276.1 hypothetical protein [Streptomyces europaeiscabiei]
MTTRFRIDRILGDRPFAEIGDPILAVRDEDHRLPAVAGACGAVASMQEFGRIAPVGVHATIDLQPAWVFRTDRKATTLDADTETVYVTYDDGELDGLDLT